MMRVLGATLLAVTVLLVMRVALAAEEKLTVDKLPPKVVSAVKAKFPEAKILAGSKEEEKGQTLYEVTLKANTGRVEVTAKEDGTIVEIETAIDAKELPGPVREQIKAKFPHGQLKKIERIVEGERTSYEVLVVSIMEVKFDPKGGVVEEEPKTSAEGD